VRQRRISRGLLIGLVAGAAVLIGLGTYAFTASNTVQQTNVGAGSAAVSGYTVSNIHYNLNATTPTNVDSLTFTISPSIPAGGSGTVVIAVDLSSGGSNRYTCTRSSTGDTVTCPTTSPQLAADTVTKLTVVAAQ
jgi:archaellin